MAAASVLTTGPIPASSPSPVWKTVAFYMAPSQTLHHSLFSLQSQALALEKTLGALPIKTLLHDFPCLSLPPSSSMASTSMPLRFTQNSHG